MAVAVWGVILLGFIPISNHAGNIYSAASASQDIDDGMIDGDNVTGSDQNETSGMNIVLVHGAWADGSSWSKVIPILRDAGHRVVAVQLPLNSVADDVATVRRTVALLGGPTLLVGHSYGGFVITNAAYNNENINGLVYVAAFAPDEGETIGGLLNIEQRPQDFLLLDADGFAYINQTYFPQAFAQDVNSTEADTMSIVQKPVRDSILNEQSGPPAWRQLPSWYQISEDDRLISPDDQRQFAERMNANTISLNSSHASLVSHPTEIAELILNATIEASGR
ncbi:MAG: alpha/beta hydrolase [Thermoproteota archaeon]